MRSNSLTVARTCAVCGIAFTATVPNQGHCAEHAHGARDFGKFGRARKLRSDAALEQERRYGTHRENAPVSAVHGRVAMLATTEDDPARAAAVNAIWGRIKGAA